MKNSDLIGRSHIKKSQSRTKVKVTSVDSSSLHGNNLKSKSERKRTKKKTETIPMGAIDCPTKTKQSTKSVNKNNNGPTSPKKNNKQSLELRPRRRASQTYFFKYQLAKNPLKAEEEDLKLALIASLEQCSSAESEVVDTPDDSTSTYKKSQSPISEDYSKKYKPETEDFLTFICFRTTAPNYQNNQIHDQPTKTSNGEDDKINSTNACHAITASMNKEKQLSTDSQGNKSKSNFLLNKLSNSKPNNADCYNPQNCNNNGSNNNNNTINNNGTIHQNHNHRPTRQSPRLASSNKKISEYDLLNHATGTSNTAYDNPINYEEEMKRASIALEDMAHEINSSDNIHDEVAQNSADSITKSPYNKHLVKGLLTREFAGGFADEETIFESISNHKL